jgi:DMSO/TMAO reductase YedYZ molybdopterin-dependent catalytic subunit
MNGQPIPLVHGGPLRLIVPGYYGVNQIKYIKRLAFTPEESDVKIMQTGYRIRPIGEKGAPSQPTAWEMGVKSWINHPVSDSPVKAGRILIDGVAFGGIRAVRRVDVSTDGGQTWQQAPFVGPNLGKYAWRQFVLPVTLGPGTYMLASRATDDAGNRQPVERLENESGYGNASWRDHAVSLTVG